MCGLGAVSWEGCPEEGLRGDRDAGRSKSRGLPLSPLRLGWWARRETPALGGSRCPREAQVPPTRQEAAEPRSRPLSQVSRGAHCSQPGRAPPRGSTASPTGSASTGEGSRSQTMTFRAAQREGGGATVNGGEAATLTWGLDLCQPQASQLLLSCEPAPGPPQNTDPLDPGNQSQSQNLHAPGPTLLHQAWAEAAGGAPWPSTHHAPQPDYRVSRPRGGP